MALLLCNKNLVLMDTNLSESLNSAFLIQANQSSIMTQVWGKLLSIETLHRCLCECHCYGHTPTSFSTYPSWDCLSWAWPCLCWKSCEGGWQNCCTIILSYTIYIMKVELNSLANQTRFKIFWEKTKARAFQNWRNNFWNYTHSPIKSIFLK
jgi:hypothetical protein